jgi:predicted signal transduction protein with EAL and GGDEF domain
MANEIEVHPVQNHHKPHQKNVVPKVLSMRAYEVYCHIYGKQEAMVTDGCRGGFGVSELLCFLYARSFPKEEWRARAEEASRGMVL